MCQYKVAKQCSERMRSTRMCHACYMHRNGERDKARRRERFQPAKTFAECLAEHKANLLYAVWL